MQSHDLVFIVLGVVRVVFGHGRLMEPPQRSSMWRFGFNVPKNYNDNALNCGGSQNYLAVENGKCLCGDSPNIAQQPNNGGMYDTGTIGRRYIDGAAIDVRVELTANHLGYFQFRLCERNNVNDVITRDCFDRNLLRLAGSGVTDYKPGSRLGVHYIKLQLPSGVTCSNCVIQWKYTSGNNHGCDKSGKCCLGCGVQETFLNCADVTITSNTAVTQAPTTQLPVVQTTPSPVVSSSCQCKGKSLWVGTLNYWCQNMCNRGVCQDMWCGCSCGVSPKVPRTCRATYKYRLVNGMDNWCQYYCEQNVVCPNDRCQCD